jgi:uncharacterized paraquat-inducible protein A
MGLLKWAGKTAYYTGKSAVRGAGRSIARDVREVSRITYEHPGCSIQHRSAEAMVKCRRGSNYSGGEVASRRQSHQSGFALSENQMVCGACKQIIPLGHTDCPSCGNQLLDEPCVGCGGEWQMTRLEGELAGFCSRCDWYVTSDGLVRLT